MNTSFKRSFLRSGIEREHFKNVYEGLSPIILDIFMKYSISTHGWYWYDH